MEIPVTIKGEKIHVRTEILEGDLPFLIGKKTMGNLGMVIDVEREYVKIKELGGMEVKLREDSQGHLRMPIIKRKEEELLLEGWLGKSKKEIRAIIMKLHLQFGHGSSNKIWQLTEKAEWSKDMREDERKEMVEELIDRCEVCRKYKRNPAKPVVGFSWGSTFNEVVAMDLGEIED